MSYRLIIRAAAEQDLEEASAWYEEQREGLGKEFLVAVGQTLETIAKEYAATRHRNTAWGLGPRYANRR